MIDDVDRRPVRPGEDSVRAGRQADAAVGGATVQELEVRVLVGTHALQGHAAPAVIGDQPTGAAEAVRAGRQVDLPHLVIVRVGASVQIPIAREVPQASQRNEARSCVDHVPAGAAEWFGGASLQRHVPGEGVAVKHVAAWVLGVSYAVQRYGHPRRKKCHHGPLSVGGLLIGERSTLIFRRHRAGEKHPRATVVSPSLPPSNAIVLGLGCQPGAARAYACRRGRQSVGLRSAQWRRPLRPSGGVMAVAVVSSAPAERIANFTEIWGLGICALRAPVGTSFTYTLNTPATVTLTITRPATGRKVKGKCVTPTSHNKHAPPCKLTIKAGTLTGPGQRGPNTVRFTGKLGSHRLAAGSYKLTITARTASGTASATLSFTIAR